MLNQFKFIHNLLLIQKLFQEYDDVPYWSFSARNEEGADLGTLNFLIFTLTSPKQDLRMYIIIDLK